jgi:hypothetical protein
MVLNLRKLFPSLEDKFRETDDPRYLILAIGESPSKPPPWALAACVVFFREHRIAVETFEDRKKKRGGRKLKHNVKDGLLLLRVARLVVGGYFITPALCKISRQDVSGSVFKRLQRAWNGALRHEKFGAPGKPRAKANKWLRIARQERMREEVMAELQRIDDEERSANAERPTKKKALPVKPRRT